VSMCNGRCNEVERSGRGEGTEGGWGRGMESGMGSVIPASDKVELVSK